MTQHYSQALKVGLTAMMSSSTLDCTNGVLWLYHLQRNRICALLLIQDVKHSVARSLISLDSELPRPLLPELNGALYPSTGLSRQR